jgi:hypothetical protein
MDMVSGVYAHFLSALYAPPASREVSPLCFLSAFASLGDVGVWPAAGSVFCGRSLCMPGEVFVRWRICYTFGAWVSLRQLLARLLSRCGRTCESGSMAASDGCLPSALLRFVVSFDRAGEVGLRSFAASFLLLSGPMGGSVRVSMCAFVFLTVLLRTRSWHDVPSCVVKDAPSCPSWEIAAFGASITLILGKVSAIVLLSPQLVSWMSPVAIGCSWRSSGNATALYDLGIRGVKYSHGPSTRGGYTRISSSEPSLPRDTAEVNKPPLSIDPGRDDMRWRTSIPCCRTRKTCLTSRHVPGAHRR